MERSAGHRWAWLGVAAGVLGAIATLFTQVATSAKNIDASVLSTLHTGEFRLGGALGYLTVASLLCLSAAWRVSVRPGIASRVVADGLTASAGALTLGYGWKLALALYLPGGVNAHEFGTQAQFIYYVLNDFGPFIGWLGVIVAAGAVAYISLREKLVATWVGIISLLPVIAVLFMSLGMTVAGFPGVVGPIWMVVAFAGLALGKHPLFVAEG